MTTIEVTAWGSVEVRGLTPTQVHALATIDAVTLAPGWETDTWKLSAGSWVGVLRAEDVELRIRPRITIARLIYLLGYAQDPKAWRDDPVGLDDQPDLWPAMAQVFVRQTEAAFQRGLLQGYRTEESSQLVMRGRLREADQLRIRAGLAIPLEVRFDEYDVDIPENQIVRAAAERLLRVPGVTPAIVRRLRAILARMADVSRLVAGQKLPATPHSRLNARYQPALAMARMVLKARSVDVLDAGVKGTGFLVNMNTVFEDFVTVAISQALAPYGGRCVPQDRHHLDHRSRVLMKPDLVRYGPTGRPQAVVDAKYKAAKFDGYPNPDVYQLLAYCTALELQAGHLVYAEGGEDTDDVVVRHASVLIQRHALALQKPVVELQAQISEVAAQIAL